MAGGMRVDGLASGMNTGALIEALTMGRMRAMEGVQLRINKVQDQRNARLEVNSALLKLQAAVAKLASRAGFDRVKAGSSHESLLRVSGDTSAITGSYRMIPRQTASGAQFVSTGLADPDRTPVSLSGGSVTVKFGDGRLARPTDLSAIPGFDRGSIRVTDDLGNVAVVDLTDALTLEEVAERISANGRARVTAAVTGNGLEVRNISGVGPIAIADTGADRTATSLGIAATDATGAIQGADLRAVRRDTLLSALNDGRGVRPTALTITGSVAINVNLAGARTVGDVLDAINGAGLGVITAAISGDGRALVLADSGAAQAPVVTAPTGTHTARDLGLEAGMLADTGAGWQGRALVAGFGTVLLDSIAGVHGGGLGADAANVAEFTITDSAGATTTVASDGRGDLRALLAAIEAGPAQVSARVSADGLGIEITDHAGGGSPLQINDVAGAMAGALGLAGSHNGAARAADIHFRHMHEAVALDSLNGGRGVTQGRVRVTLRDGRSAELNLANARTAGDVLSALNGINGLRASINATGDGIVLEDQTAGTGELAVEDVSGNVAAALHLRGRFGGAVVDRRRQVSVQVSATDTLNDVMLKLASQSDLLTLNTFGDGSPGNPARLSIAGRHSGAAANFTVHSTIEGLGFTRTAEARDAVLLMGDGGGEPQVLRSRDGAFRMLPGITIDVLAASSQPVTVSLARDLSAMEGQVTGLVEAWNEADALVKSLSGFDIQNLQAGVLHGDSVLRELVAGMRRALLDPVAGTGALQNSAALGLRLDSRGQLTLDAARLRAALEQRPDEVAELFTRRAPLGQATPLSAFANGRGIPTGPGAELRAELADGSALEIDLDGLRDVAGLLARLNADGRITASLRADGMGLELRDNTTGTGQFAIRDTASGGALAALGFLSGQSQDGRITGEAVTTAENPGLARRMDELLGRYLDPREGVFRRADEEARSAITRHEETIARMNRSLNLEVRRLSMQFSAMEQFILQSQNAQARLTAQLRAIQPQG